MANRRDPFVVSETSPIPDIYSSLRVASPRERNRQWERKHQSQKVVYRGVEPKLALKVKTIAQELSVPDGEVARAMLEYALRANQEGDLELHPTPNPYRMRMTLFPSSRSSRDEQGLAKRSRKMPREALWKVITTWRGFPTELKQEIANLASEDGLNVPAGELVTALLRFGLKAYEAGALVLEPIQKATSLTLFVEGKP